MATIRVGVAGWDYPDWKGILYPKPRPRGFDPIPYLAEFLDIVEINSTFYGAPKKHVAQDWVKRADGLDDFRYSAKLLRRFTHERKTAWTRKELREARAGMDVLLASGKLSALLAQFPWSFRNDETSRDWLADVRTAFAQYPLVVEVRHESWNEPGFFEWLAENGVGFVNIDQPLFKKSIKPSAHATSHVGYIRVHGRNYQDWFRKNAGRDARYDYLYSVAELKPWAARARQLAKDEDTEEVDVVFNNHYKAQAAVNAAEMKGLLKRRKPRAPELLAEHYPERLS